MATIKKCEELKIWQKARMFSRTIIEVTQEEKFSRDYKLKNQINGSSGSIMDNIAEGFGRKGNREFINFLTIANGSAMETKSQLYRALDRYYISQSKMDQLTMMIEEISRMLNALILHLGRSEYDGQKFKPRERNKKPPNSPTPNFQTI